MDGGNQVSGDLGCTPLPRTWQGWVKTVMGEQGWATESGVNQDLARETEATLGITIEGV